MPLRSGVISGGTCRCAIAVQTATSITTVMTNLGELVLPPDVPGLYNTSIDPFNSRAYTGARRSPALVTVNIRGSLPTVVQEAVPTAMPPDVPSLTMRLVDVSDGDPRKHYIYATEHGNQ